MPWLSIFIPGVDVNVVEQKPNTETALRRMLGDVLGERLYNRLGSNDKAAFDRWLGNTPKVWRMIPYQQPLCKVLNGFRFKAASGLMLLQTVQALTKALEDDLEIQRLQKKKPEAARKLGKYLTRQRKGLTRADLKTVADRLLELLSTANLAP